MGKRLCLIGVTGKKSGGVLAELISKNIQLINKMFPDGIVVLTRPESDISKLKVLLPEAEIHGGNIADPAFLQKYFKDVDTVIHLASIHYSSGITDSAVVCHVRRLILIHTTGIYSKYKAAGEGYRKIDDYVYRVCRENNIVLTICRPTMIYGNIYDNNVIVFVKMVDKLPIMPVVNGARYELQPVHYSDLAKAYYEILVHEETTGNKDFNLSGGKPIMLRDMLIVIGQNLGKKVHFISCPFIIAYGGAWLVYLLSFKKMDMREKVQRLCEPRTFTHEEASEAFGYAPMNFEEGIVAEVKQYMNNEGISENFITK